MNQILVTEKLYITPELKRKKKIYKFNFIASIIVIVILSLSYAHSEYAKYKEEEVSDDILSQMVAEAEKTTAEEEKIAKEQEEGVWKVMIASAKRQEQKADTSSPTNTDKNSSSTQTEENTNKRTKTYTASNGKRYQSLGTIKIPKIGVNCAILDEPEEEEQMVQWLKVSPCKFYGVDPNEVGNCSIAGHNYRNKRFFSKVPNLTVGDRIQITDVQNRTITYSVYDKYTVEPTETDCIYENIPGKRIITLITCTNDSSQRVIVHAKEI